MDQDLSPEVAGRPVRIESPYHQVRFMYDPDRARVWRVVARYLQSYIREDDALLDLGAGYGEFSRFIRARERCALELHHELAEYWEASVRRLIQSALDPLPLESRSVGTVFASNFFEHFSLDECRQILSEVQRVLKPRGRLMVIQPNFRLQPGRYFDDFTHKTPFTDNGFRDFLTSVGFRIIRSEPRFLPFSMSFRLPKWGWLVDLYLALPYRPLAGQFLIVAES